MPADTDARRPVAVAKRSEIEAALRRLAPKIPPHEFAAVVDHAMDSTGLRPAPAENAAWLSLVAYVRHVFTDYDALLTEGYDHDSARFFVVAEMDGILRGWGIRRRIGPQD
jgi:hypothetical protein